MFVRNAAANGGRALVILNIPTTFLGLEANSLTDGEPRESECNRTIWLFLVQGVRRDLRVKKGVWLETSRGFGPLARLAAKSRD